MVTSGTTGRGNARTDNVTNSKKEEKALWSILMLDVDEMIFFPVVANKNNALQMDQIHPRPRTSYEVPGQRRKVKQRPCQSFIVVWAPNKRRRSRKQGKKKRKINASQFCER